MFGSTRPPLAIALNPGLPDHIAIEALDLLNDAGTPAALLRLPGGPYAGLEFYQPIGGQVVVTYDAKLGRIVSVDVLASVRALAE